MGLKIEAAESGQGIELDCPACGSMYLHQAKVEVFERDEDAEMGLHVKVQREKVTTDTDLSNNPSQRRQGVTISFTCEYCDANPVLSLSQDRGLTLVAFNY